MTIEATSIVLRRRRAASRRARIRQNSLSGTANVFGLPICEKRTRGTVTTDSATTSDLGSKFLHSWQVDQSLRQAAFERPKDQRRVSQPAMYPHQVPIRRATLA